MCYMSIKKSFKQKKDWSKATAYKPAAYQQRVQTKGTKAHLFSAVLHEEGNTCLISDDIGHREEGKVTFL